MPSFLLLWVACCTTQLLMTAAPSVKEVGGNILLVQDDGSIKRLTSGGRDSMPSLSSDGKKIVFVRSEGKDRPDDLCLIDLSQPLSQEPLILPSTLPDLKEFGEILDPQFSPDSSSVYFYAQPSNFGLIISRKIESGDSRVIAHSVIPIKGKSFDVIQRGKYAGDLIVNKDSEKLTAGRLFLYWLVNADGKNLSIIGDKDADLELFRSSAGLKHSAP